MIDTRGEGERGGGGGGEEGDGNWMSTSDYLSPDQSSQVVYTGGNCLVNITAKSLRSLLNRYSAKDVPLINI